MLFWGAKGWERGSMMEGYSRLNSLASYSCGILKGDQARLKKKTASQDLNLALPHTAALPGKQWLLPEADFLPYQPGKRDAICLVHYNDILPKSPSRLQVRFLVNHDMIIHQQIVNSPRH